MAMKTRMTSRRSVMSSTTKSPYADISAEDDAKIRKDFGVKSDEKYGMTPGQYAAWKKYGTKATAAQAKEMNAKDETGMIGVGITPLGKNPKTTTTKDATTTPSATTKKTVEKVPVKPIPIKKASVSSSANRNIRGNSLAIEKSNLVPKFIEGTTKPGKKLAIVPKKVGYGQKSNATGTDKSFNNRKQTQKKSSDTLKIVPNFDKTKSVNARMKKEQKRTAGRERALGLHGVMVDEKNKVVGPKIEGSLDFIRRNLPTESPKKDVNLGTKPFARERMQSLKQGKKDVRQFAAQTRKERRKETPSKKVKIVPTATNTKADIKAGIKNIKANKIEQKKNTKAFIKGAKKDVRLGIKAERMDKRAKLGRPGGMKYYTMDELSKTVNYNGTPGTMQSGTKRYSSK
jgi:hypothetical protein